MQTITPTVFVAAIVAALLGHAPPAQAATQYPWCAVYTGDDGGGTNCGFSTIEQCRATVSGIGGSCEPNLFYTGPAKRPAKPARKRPNN